MSVMTRINSNHRDPEILAASRSRTGWQNTQSPTHRQPDKKPQIESIRSTFEEKQQSDHNMRDQASGNQQNGHSNSDSKGRAENRRMGAKVSAIANIFQSLSPTPGQAGSPTAAAQATSPVVTSPVLGEKPTPAARTDGSSISTRSSRTTTGTVISDNKSNGSAKTAASSVITANKINSGGISNSGAGSPKPRLSPKEGRRLAAEKKENLLNGAGSVADRKPIKSLNSNVLQSGAKISRTESRVTRFNNARAVFEKLVKDPKSGGSESDSSLSPSIEKSTVLLSPQTSAKPTSRPTSAYSSTEFIVEETLAANAALTRKLSSGTLNNKTQAAIIETQAASKELRDGDASKDVVPELFARRSSGSNQTPADPINRDAQTKLNNNTQRPGDTTTGMAFKDQPAAASVSAASKVSNLFQSDEHTKSIKSYDKSSVNDLLLKKETPPLLKSQSVDSRVSNGHSSSVPKPTERSTSTKPRSPIKRTSSLSAKEELLDKIVSDLAEDKKANKENDLALDELSDLNLCDTSGIPDTLDFDECFQGVELMTEEEAEKLLSHSTRSTWPDLLSEQVVQDVSRDVSPMHSSTSSVIEAQPAPVNTTAAASSLSSVKKQPEHEPRERPVHVGSLLQPDILTQQTQPKVVVEQQLPQEQVEQGAFINDNCVGEGRPPTKREVDSEQVTDAAATDEPTNSSFNNNTSGESSVILDDIEYTVFVDGHYCSDTPGLLDSSDCEEDSVTMFLCPVPARKKTTVKFSNKPIRCFSTHAVEDYDRRNEDVDPIAASAEYELEKRIEKMDVFPVELEKGPDGLGLSIIGMGVGADAGLEKLGIFVKTITELGAAYHDGRIQVNDQIIEVDGKSLVGVTQAYAASVLRSTSGRVNFLIGREKDVANSEIAQLISQSIQAERQRESVDYSPLDQAPNKALPREPESVDDSQGQCDSLSEAVELLSETASAPIRDEEEQCPSYHAINERNNDLETLNAELKEWQLKYSRLRDELTRVKDKAEVNSRDAQLQLEHVQEKLCETECALNNARQENENYQKLLEEARIQYSIIEKKYHKAKKLIKEMNQ